MKIKSNNLLILTGLLALASCGGSSGGGSSSSSSSQLIPMISDINCGSSSCAPTSFNKSTAAEVLNNGVELYDAINDEVIPEMKATMKKMNELLNAGGIASCDAIPETGSMTTIISGKNVKVEFSPAKNLNLFNLGVSVTKQVQAYNSDDSDKKFFEAQFNCGEERVGYVKADYTILDPTDKNKFVLSFYEKGNTRKLSIFTEYLNSKTSKDEVYMAIFSTDGSSFEGHFAFNSDITTTGGIVLAFNKSDTGVRVISDYGSTLNLLDDNESDFTANNATTHNYCYTTSLSTEACAAHPSINVLNGNNNSESLSSVSTGEAFTNATTTSLDFSFL